MTDNDFTLGPSAAFGANISTTRHPVGQFEPDPRDTRIAELEAALSSIDVYGSDTLSGQSSAALVPGADWFRMGVREMRDRARAALRGEGR